MKLPRLSPQTFRVLERFVEYPRLGLRILSRDTGLQSGTLYPILMRVAKYSLLETTWVVTGDGVSRRHTFRLTAKGMEVARARFTRACSGRRITPDPASTPKNFGSLWPGGLSSRSFSRSFFSFF